jgi:hypothetical protein
MVLVVAACGDASTKDPNTQTQSPTTTSVPNAPDPSSSSSSSSSSGGGDTDAGGGVAACLAACEAKYPAGVPKGDAIDACWKQNCYDPCNGMAPSSTQFGAQHGACKYDVKTPAAACSQCTVDKCCAAWDACFGDEDCAALNKCTIACYGD